jgi:WD40 repeat protein
MAFIQVSPHAVYGIYTSPPDAGQFILTAGSDRRIRLWDLQSPDDSCIVAGSSSDNLNDVVLKYKYVVSAIAAWEFRRLVQ